MSGLKNELTWSTSRRKLFDRCRRAYWYRYYGHWGGWSREAPAHVRLAWILGKMSSLPMWVGTVVHQAIQECIEEYGAEGVFPDLAHAEARGVALLRRGWVESRDRRWEADPRRAVNLLEHYYGRPIEARQTDRVKEDVLRCLRAFYETEVASWLRTSDPGDWLNVEALDHFLVDGVRVFVKPDLACRRGGRVVLYDWKTGRRADDDLRQLGAYALFARERWGAPSDSVDVRAVYLREGDVVDVPVDDEGLAGIAGEISASIAEMRAPLDDPEANVARRDRFPRVDHPATCRDCAFQHFCWGPEGWSPGAESRELYGD
ncbi:PD-(D/E)XK nuclease family protein [Myxococcota bacterium]|nr:PD-(D/E)XK nuclease family protein [Myxococcota bacterium]